MKGLPAILVFAVASLVLAGCTQSAPPPSPTKAPAAPTSPISPTKAAAEPTKAQAVPTQAPTVPPAPTKAAVAPATKVDFPTKGKSIAFIVPWPAGSITDIIARVLAPTIEKELGVPVQVSNKTGAGSQVGLAELALAKPDGYSIGYTNIPAAITIYLDPDRKATFNRKSFVPLVLNSVDPVGIGVKGDSRYKTMKDLVDAAKANPDKVKVATTGILGPAHLATLLLEKATGAKFSAVHFDGGAPTVTALLGGHVDVAAPTLGNLVPQVKSGEIRLIAITDSQRSKFFPDVPTAEEQGYKVVMSTSQGISAPAGTPKEVAQILANAVKKAMEADVYTSRMPELALVPSYMGPDQYAAYWDQMEASVTPLMSLAKQ